MNLTTRRVLGASLLALAGWLGVGTAPAQAQVGSYVQPGMLYPRSEYRGNPYGYSAPNRGYAATSPVARPARLVPGRWGYGEHLGYYPTRRGLPLYKPWLSRD